jgi:glycosyltransferase involved in cell wall biosynthesis
MQSKNAHIALLMMVKNESKRILNSLTSVLGTVKSVVIYDTGSTDNTIALIENFCNNHNLPLRLKTGVFENFSTSRNVSLDFADSFSDIDYLLLLDGNDELRNGNILQLAADEFKNRTNSGFMLCQEWKNIDNTITKYFNLRFMKARSGWRYKGSVHEYLANPTSTEYGVRLDDKITLFQDRKYDAEKSLSRYTKDKELLLQDYENDPSDGRTLFYLAQTYGCLDELEKCYEFYKLRVQTGGFLEEVFHSYLRMGEVGARLGRQWNIILDHFICAFEVLGRAEPLVRLAEYYRSQNMWKSAYMFIKKACELEYPKQAVLFVDKRLYEYGRWHLLGIVAYYDEKYKEGEEACRMAIKTGPEFEIDKNNLKFYLEKLGKCKKNKNRKKRR